MKSAVIVLVTWIYLFNISGSVAEDRAEFNEELSYPEFPEHLPGAFTGGFGELTCRSCHFDYDLNWEEGSLAVSGISEVLRPNRDYVIGITLEREDMGKAGFQLSVRDQHGEQIGTFLISENEELMLTELESNPLHYVQHSKEGTQNIVDGKTAWSIKWKSPQILPDSIIFNVSANAANGDESEFGDWIYSKEIVIQSPN